LDVVGFGHAHNGDCRTDEHGKDQAQSLVFPGPFHKCATLNTIFFRTPPSHDTGTPEEFSGKYVNTNIYKKDK
jgi:hypothetical protein